VELQKCLFEEETDKSCNCEILLGFGQKSQKMSSMLLTRSSSPQRRNYQNRPNLELS